jgi:hypothetical protein
MVLLHLCMVIQTQQMVVIQSNGLYGAGRFAYSINQFSASATVTAATASWDQVQYAAELSASILQ